MHAAETDGGAEPKNTLKMNEKYVHESIIAYISYLFVLLVFLL